MDEEDVVFVPTRARDDSGNLLVEIRTLADGQRALPAYTSLDTLVRALGQRQPWVALDQRGMTQVQVATDYEIVLINPPKPEPSPIVELIEEPEPGDQLPHSWLEPSKRGRR
ncbi:SseB family protein [Antrihabitans cavernicola]|uniref:SseB family protein n=1 Tax=Antrihabitans cavernicola TaxID=2495913 RepID=A0A5A7SJS1_9NOCA|nr:SAV_915 family protein [Spelaeibacter cavernicola]KAA0024441.1 SseB family protein [Spelaeibacter cavernicola]